MTDVQLINYVKTKKNVYSIQTKLLEIELFDHLTVCKTF